jgi:hypothetical protein
MLKRLEGEAKQKCRHLSNKFSNLFVAERIPPTVPVYMAHEVRSDTLQSDPAVREVLPLLLWGPSCVSLSL